MKLYLVRHGDAVSEEVDPQRPLSERGRAGVERIAAFLNSAGICVAAVLHSGKKRAAQTAELLAPSLGAGARLEKIAGIDPFDPTGRFARTVSEWGDDMMVVGHLPFMAKLVSRLVVGDEAACTISFQPGTVVCVERTEEGTWLIAWMIRPELVADAIVKKPF